MHRTGAATVFCMTSQQPIDSICYLRISGQYTLIDYAWRFVVLKLSCGNDGAILEFDLKAHMHLKKSHFNKSNFNKSHFNKSNFNESHFNKSNLNKSNLSKSNLRHAVMQNSSQESILHSFVNSALCCCYQWRLMISNRASQERISVQR